MTPKEINSGRLLTAAELCQIQGAVCKAVYCRECGVFYTDLLPSTDDPCKNCNEEVLVEVHWALTNVFPALLAHVAEQDKELAKWQGCDVKKLELDYLAALKQIAALEAERAASKRKGASHDQAKEVKKGR
jgi:hypothetical protein